MRNKLIAAIAVSLAVACLFTGCTGKKEEAGSEKAVKQSKELTIYCALPETGDSLLR